MTRIDEYIDKKLVVRFKNGDMSAFQRIYDSFCQPLYRFALSYLKDSFEAEEIVQDVFLKVWENRLDIDIQKSFKSYLYRITVNKIFNELKHRVVKHKYEQHLLHTDQQFNESPESAIQFQELNSKLDILLTKLPDQQRTIFIMSRWKGLSNAEISEKLSLSIRTVENQIYRAAKFIKLNINDDYPIGILVIIFGLQSL
ncbi:MAG TPA: RNA polymerase sigma-70 factor [Prolixibacteraceae bacterium]|nr:RNA polymerase sigma-70 factor [Prolixibacteraceae bacterium]